MAMLQAVRHRIDRTAARIWSRGAKLDEGMGTISRRMMADGILHLGRRTRLRPTSSPRTGGEEASRDSRLGFGAALRVLLHGPGAVAAIHELPLSVEAAMHSGHDEMRVFREIIVAHDLQEL